MALRGSGLIPFAGTDFAPLFSFRRELDRLFNDRFSGAGTTGWAPAVDVREDNNNLYLDVELPGLQPEDVDINVDNGVLTISGEKSTENRENKEDQRFHTVERSYGAFFRSFQLPQGIDEEQINATFHNGVLTVDIPKSALPQPRKIQIGAGGRQQVSSGQSREQASGRTGGRSSGKGERMVAGGREGESRQASAQEGQSSQQRQSSRQSK